MLNKFQMKHNDLLKCKNSFDAVEFEECYGYAGELGVCYKKAYTTFVVWAPTATNVQLILYDKNGNVTESVIQSQEQMLQGEHGTWQYTHSGDLAGNYYNYLITVNGAVYEVVDPYAVAVGVNGTRGMIVDLRTTDPEGWEMDERPVLKSPLEAMIYEVHMRDFTIGMGQEQLPWRGKYKGFWKKGLTLPDTKIKIGIDHLLELGVNVVQLMPIFDYNSVDENQLDKPQFNWGYDPQNYNAPEGSYASNPYDGTVRIKELKQLIYELHHNNIKVIMDVVYNHTTKTIDSNFNLAVPGYYYRSYEDGSYSNGSGCGNELASERLMVRKFIVDSVTYWAKAYHIDGFRFDLMGVHDKQTMLAIRTALDAIDPSIIMLGEGWTGGPSTLDLEKQSLKKNIAKHFGKQQIAAFSDDMRDGLRGHVFTAEAGAFLQGKTGFEEEVKLAIVAATPNSQMNCSKLRDNTTAWAAEPYQTINYVSCHDNFTLWDKLQMTMPTASLQERLAINKIAAAVIYTSQGIPFMLSGEEFARTKVNEDGSLNENSYNANDQVNAIDWERKAQYIGLYNYYKGLIHLRKMHPAFRLTSTTQIQSYLKFIEIDVPNVIAYTLICKAEVEEPWQQIVVAFNTNKVPVEVPLPHSNWVVVVNEEAAGITKLGEIHGDTLNMPGLSAYVLVDAISFE